MESHSLWGAGWDGSDPGPAPLSGQVLSWPVDDDPEENTATNKERQGQKKNGGKVGYWERTMTKLYLNCKNSDGRTWPGCSGGQGAGLGVLLSDKGAPTFC